MDINSSGSYVSILISASFRKQAARCAGNEGARLRTAAWEFKKPDSDVFIISHLANKTPTPRQCLVPIDLVSQLPTNSQFISRKIPLDRDGESRDYFSPHQLTKPDTAAIPELGSLLVAREFLVSLDFHSHQNLCKGSRCTGNTFTMLG